MINKTTDLYEYFGLERPEKAAGYLQSYIHYQSEEYCVGRKRPAMIVIAGGGYAYVSDREKEPVALYYFSKGYNVFTLDYSVSPVNYPFQLTEACMAVAYVRENAQSMGINPDEVAAIGFSAGGHLAGMLATISFDRETTSIKANDDNCVSFKDTTVERQVSDPDVVCMLKEKFNLCRPDAVILSYPVVSFAHDGVSESISRLTGGNGALSDKLSLQKRVTEKSSPAFIWCTADDACVPANNSMILAKAYAEKKVPYELHIFPSGPHGLSICSEETAPEGRNDYLNPAVGRWTELSFNWLKNLGFGIKTEH